MKTRLLAPVRRLIAAAAAEVLERDAASPSRQETQLAEARRLVRDQLGQLFVAERQIEKDIVALSAELNALFGKAHVAVGKDREDLARTALAHRLDLEQRIAWLEAERADARAEIATLERASDVLSAGIDPDDPSPCVSIAAQLAELDRLVQSEVQSEAET